MKSQQVSLYFATIFLKNIQIGCAFMMYYLLIYLEQLFWHWCGVGWVMYVKRVNNIDQKHNLCQKIRCIYIWQYISIGVSNFSKPNNLRSPFNLLKKNYSFAFIHSPSEGGRKWRKRRICWTWCGRPVWELRPPNWGNGLACRRLKLDVSPEACDVLAFIPNPELAKLGKFFLGWAWFSKLG